MNDKQLRLLIVSNSLSGGGAERFTSTLLSHLNRDKFKLMLCLVHDDRDYFLPDYVPVMSL
ncbi:MAG: hypothetical protein SV775_19965, partial [Thermodesulfobacteriota bacterium]|nr:hypothetical protein [Thermodesulfobacteriota bacterium]